MFDIQMEAKKSILDLVEEIEHCRRLMRELTYQIAELESDWWTEWLAEEREQLRWHKKRLSEQLLKQMLE